MIFRETISYLEYNFGFNIMDSDWRGVNKLPMYLSKGYDYCEIQISGQTLLLMDCSRQHERSVDDIKVHVRKLQDFTTYNNEIIILYNHASNYHRERMLAERMSFIIPGKQIYVPVLGFVFGEKKLSRYPIKSKEGTSKMAPTTQALILELLATNGIKKSSKELANTLGVTQMSISRAYKELEEMDIVIRRGNYNKSKFDFADKRESIWNKIYDNFEKPIIKSIYVKEDAINDQLKQRLIMSGESALSKNSMLGSPRYKVYGITNKEFKKYSEKIVQQPFLDLGSCEIELWRHEMSKKNGVLNPLGIALVLREESDERVQAQIEQMIKKYNWKE